MALWSFCSIFIKDPVCFKKKGSKNLVDVVRDLCPEYYKPYSETNITSFYSNGLLKIDVKSSELLGSSFDLFIQKVLKEFKKLNESYHYVEVYSNYYL